MNRIITRLLASVEPSVRWNVRAHILDTASDSAAMRALRETIRQSPRVRRLLSQRDAQGELSHHPYRKWLGAHWTLAALAELGYPPGDPALIPLREQVLRWLFSPDHLNSIQTIRGRVRRCASQEGYALWYLLQLGLGDERADVLAARLREWQWDDGGWNCDKNPAAIHSSFNESLLPMRGLALHARFTGDLASRRAAQRASELFLKRALFRRLSDGNIIRPDFVKLHYPAYWHYDILIALKIMAEMGLLHDPRTLPALELLESRELPDGGFPADKTYYRHSTTAPTGTSLVSWGSARQERMNEWVTADALYVLKAAGRLALGESALLPSAHDYALA